LTGKSVAGLGGSAGAGAATAAAAIAGCSVCQTTGDDDQADTSGGAQTTGGTGSRVTAGTGRGVVLSETHAGGEQQTTGQQGDCLFFHISTPQDGFLGLYPVHSSWEPYVTHWFPYLMINGRAHRPICTRTGNKHSCHSHRRRPFSAPR